MAAYKSGSKPAVENGLKKIAVQIAAADTLNLMANPIGDTKQKWTHLVTPVDSEARRSSVVSQISMTSSRRNSTVPFGESPVHHVVALTETDVQADETGMSAARNDTKSAIPFLPLSAALVCFMFNIVIPGTGTILAGVCSLFCGEPRVHDKAGQRMATLCTNTMVGTAQLFTVSFMLVGWFWSLTWGIYMLILAVEYRKKKNEQRRKELQVNALGAMSSQIRPWTLKPT